MVARDASDLYLSVGAPPTLKIEGQMHGLVRSPLTPEHIDALIWGLLDPEQRATFEALWELDLSAHFKGVGRFRFNLYRHKSAAAMVVRYIKDKIPSLDSLGLPEVLHDLVMEERGLILVVGNAGSGKSTTMASMLGYRNSHCAGHILTIEDPIEFTHQHDRSLVSQRELGIDTHSFADALRQALREAPDVIMIGEIRDLDTARQALRYAETGHLCLSSLHASNSTQALERLLHFFEGAEQGYARQQLANNLVAVVAQRLAMGFEERRVVAVELLLNNLRMAKLIAAGEMPPLREALQQESASHTFEEALHKLVHKGMISHKEGLRLADSRVDMALRFKQPVALVAEQTQEHHWLSPGVNFKRYARAQVIAKRSSSQRRPEMQQHLDEAVSQALAERGYQVVTDKPDILVRYAYGLRYAHDINLPMINGSGHDESLEDVHSKLEAGLAVKAVDASSRETLWYMTCTKPLNSDGVLQSELNIEMANLFASLPFAGVDSLMGQSS